jgi:hypothetical protein
MAEIQATLGQIALSTGFQDIYASGNARAEGTLHLSNTGATDRRVTVTLEAAASSSNGVAETIFSGIVNGSGTDGENTAQIRYISMDPTMDLRAKQDTGTDVSAAFLGQEFA